MPKNDKGWVNPKDKIPLHVVGHQNLVEAMFALKPQFKLSSVLDAKVVCFTGGEDVNPALYGDIPHPSTRSNPARDTHEAKIFKTIRQRQVEGKQDVTFVGICRGGQFLNVMNGGTLYQDCDHHTASHIIKYTRLHGQDVEVMVSSTHHQMMIPASGGLLWGRAHLSSFRDRGSDKKVPRPSGHPDAEIVFYPRTKTLCFQPHPEYFSSTNDACRDLFFNCLFRAMLSDRNQRTMAKVLEDDGTLGFVDRRMVM